jgi:uncharacterized repeat protein (TIGR03833 family)
MQVHEFSLLVAYDSYGEYALPPALTDATLVRKGVNTKMNGQTRSNIKIGALVDIVLKKDQPTGKLTRGHVMRILTNSPTHPHGIKVMLTEGGQVGRVQAIIET